MAAMRRLTTREKVILATTIVLVIGVAVYFGLLGSFIEGYSEVAQNLDKARQDYEQARELLKDADKVDRKFQAIAATLPKRQAGKTPEALFTEQVETLFRRMNVPPGYYIKPAKEPEPVQGVPGYAYLVLPVENIQGDLARIVAVLTGFYQQNFLIGRLTLKAGPANIREPNLSMSIEVAQILRASDLGITEEKGEATPEEDSGARVKRRVKQPAQAEEMGME